MQLYYYKDPIGNFGDDLNPWLWPQLFPKPLEQCFDPDTLFIGIGSVLNHKIADKPEKKIVFGSGHGYGSLPAVTQQWRFCCVRGPLTAKVLGLPASTAISDGALLVRKLLAPAQTTDGGPAFMPHHVTAKHHDWRRVCEMVGVRYIDPADPVEQTLEVVRRSSVVISESLHGAIIADAFRVPWVAVRSRPRILEFKWQDWCRSLQLEQTFAWVPPVWSTQHHARLKQMLYPFSTKLACERLRWLVRYGERKLSRDAVFQSVYARMCEAFAELLEEMVNEKTVYQEIG